MEKDLNFKIEDIYRNMDEKHTKKLLDEPSSSTNIGDSFLSTSICSCLLSCFLLCV
jgi:hypothetical protein